MKISWITGNQNWAYKNLEKHNSKALAEHKHTENEKEADVIVAMCPQVLAGQDLSRTILHLDSKRILGQ